MVTTISHPNAGGRVPLTTDMDVGTFAYLSKENRDVILAT